MTKVTRLCNCCEKEIISSQKYITIPSLDIMTEEGNNIKGKTSFNANLDFCDEKCFKDYIDILFKCYSDNTNNKYWEYE